MAKYTPTTIAAGLTSQSKINANFQEIADILNDRVLFRDLTLTPGEPNVVQQDLDMNSNRLLNLKDAVAQQDAVTLKDLEGRLSGTRSVETVTATVDGTILITFSTLVYTVAIQSLQIYINGIRQPLGAAYTETSTTSITLLEGINNGDQVHAIALFE